MVAFIVTFDLNVRSLRVITESKRSNFDFSIKKLNRIQNLLRISMMFLVVVYDDNKCQKNHFLWIPYGCAQTVTMFAMPKRIDWHVTWYSYSIIWPWGPVTWGQILKLVFRGRLAWFTDKKHSGALGFAVISIIKKLFSKRFRLKRSLIFTFSLPPVTNDTQETEITTDKNWDNDRILRPWLWFQVPVRPTSSRGRPRRVYVPADVHLFALLVVQSTKPPQPICI